MQPSPSAETVGPCVPSERTSMRPPSEPAIILRATRQKGVFCARLELGDARRAAEESEPAPADADLGRPLVREEERHRLRVPVSARVLERRGGRRAAGAAGAPPDAGRRETYRADPRERRLLRKWRGPRAAARLLFDQPDAGAAFRGEPASGSGGCRRPRGRSRRRGSASCRGPGRRTSPPRPPGTARARTRGEWSRAAPSRARPLATARKPLSENLRDRAASSPSAYGTPKPPPKSTERSGTRTFLSK